MRRRRRIDVMDKYILIVEDQAIVSMTLESQLEELGYKVAGIASTGTEAISLAREKKPDLILMDINLEGGMDGITAAEQIGLFLDSPIIYLTAYSDAETIRRAGLTSPFTYLTKPYKLRDLHSNIEMALYKKKLTVTSDLRERRLQALLKKVADPLIATDEKGVIIFINDPATVILGIDPSDALEQPLEQVFRINDTAKNPLFLKAGPDEPETPGLLGFPFQCTLINREFQEIPIMISTSMIKNRENNYGGLFLVFRDCRPMIETRQRLADLEKNTRIILDAIMLPVVIIDRDFRIQEYNLAFADWCSETGVNATLDNKNIKSITGLLKAIRPAQLNQVFETSRPVIIEEEIGRGKQTLMFEIRFVPLEGKGKTNRILITIRDNTAEQVLKRSGMAPVAANKQLLDNIVGHFSDILGCLMEIRSLSLMEDPTVEKDWISEQIVRYIEKAERTSSELYEIFLRELSGKHTFQQVYDEKKKQIDKERRYVVQYLK
jgi:PAS domain S-box-containing protein